MVSVPDDAEVFRKVMQARVDAVSRAIAKLPKHPGTTYRGARSDDRQFARYAEGTIVREPGFTSTSADLRVATENFATDGVVLVTGTTGADLSEFSEHPEESEVLYDHGTAFLVTYRGEDSSTGLRVVQLKEWPPGDEPPDEGRAVTDDERRDAERALEQFRRDWQRLRAEPTITVTSPGKFTEPLGIAGDQPGLGG